MENEFGHIGRGTSGDTRSSRPARTKLADLLDNIMIPDDVSADDIIQDETMQNGISQGSFGKGHSNHGNPSRGTLLEDETSECNDLDHHSFDTSAKNDLPFSGHGPDTRNEFAGDLVERKTASNADSYFQDRVAQARGDAALNDETQGNGIQSDSSQAAHAFRVNMDTQDGASREAGRSSNINIKGRADGISIEIGRGNWLELMTELSERLRQASGFFRGGKVTLDVGSRPLQENELKQVVSILEQHSMTLGVIKTTSEQTCQIALANGLAASLDAPEGMQAQPAYSNEESLRHFVYRGNIRSGQILQRTETVLILGDVNPGAQVISHGDILIWGRLRGIVHAGANGDMNAIVAALAMLPTQIRIAQLTATLPDEKPARNSRWLSGQEATRRPEIAFASGNQIIVDPWDESKPGGIMAFRR